MKEENSAGKGGKYARATSTGGQGGKPSVGAASCQSDGVIRQKRERSPAVQALLGMYQQRYYQTHREEVRQNQRQYQEANRPLHREAGARLRAARREQGLSQHQLGEILGVGKGAVCHWEQGRVPYDLNKLSLVLPGLAAGTAKHIRTLKLGKSPHCRHGAGIATSAAGKTACRCVRTGSQRKADV